MEKLLLTTYLASAIEHSKHVLDGKQEDWKDVIKKELVHPLIAIYDPVEREAQKTGKKSGEHVGYVVGLKQGGHWEKFLYEMKKIWWGRINPRGHKVDIMKQLRNRFLIDGNELRDLDFWGDIEAVLRSDFICVYMEKNVKTIGTVREITYAEMFDIPIYLILPDTTKAEANSTLLEMVINSGGSICYSAKDVTKIIKQKYPIDWK
jgi:hypothetical protein